MSSTVPSGVNAMRTSVISTEALGSRAARFGASVVDGLLVIVTAGIIALAMHSTVAYYLLGIVVSVLYNVLLLIRPGDHNGQTLGKQWLDLRVVSTSGVPITFGIACKRELLGRSLPNMITLGAYGFIDSLWMLWDDRKQTLHDKIGGTYVFTAIADPAQAPNLAVPGPAVFAGGSPTPPPPPPPPAPPS